MPRSAARILAPSALLALLAAAATAEAAVAAGAVRAGGSRAALSLEAHAAPFGAVRDAVSAYDLWLHAGVDDASPLTVSFAGLPPREAAARIGEALGGLAPLEVSWPDPRLPGRPRSEHFLVRGATPAQRELAAYCTPGAGFAYPLLAERLRARGPALLPDLRGALAAATDPAARARAVGLLGRIGTAEAAALLRRHLRADPTPLAREAAAVALGFAGDAAARDPLRAALADADVGVALAAAWSLVRLGDAAGVPLAAAKLLAADAATGLRAIDVLEEAGDARHAAALDEAAAAAPAGLVRGRARAAAVVLRSAGLPEAERAAALEPLLADPVLEVRAGARSALGRLGAATALAVYDRVAAGPAGPGRAEAVRAADALRRSLAPPAPPAVIE